MSLAEPVAVPPDPHCSTHRLERLETTHRVGLALAGALPAQAVLLFSGPMGAGKTTLIKALCEGLGIDPRVVISPTYTLVNVYPGPRSVYHVDLFRLEHPEALLELDRADWVNPDGPTCIEWPEAARPLFAGEPVLEVALAVPPEARDARLLRLEGDRAHYGAAFAAVAAVVPPGTDAWPPEPAAPATPTEP